MRRTSMCHTSMYHVGACVTRACVMWAHVSHEHLTVSTIESIIVSKESIFHRSASVPRSAILIELNISEPEFSTRSSVVSMCSAAHPLRHMPFSRASLHSRQTRPNRHTNQKASNVYMLIFPWYGSRGIAPTCMNESVWPPRSKVTRS